MHIEKNGLRPDFVLLTNEPTMKARELETFYYEKYKDKGYSMLNVKETGASIGSPRKFIHSFETARPIALKFKKRSDFRKDNICRYYILMKKGILNQVCEGLIDDVTKNTHTFDEIMNIALKYEYRIDFRKNEPNICAYSRVKGWYDKIIEHMEEKKFIPRIWTLEICKEEALKYERIIDMRNQNPLCYGAIKSNKWQHIVFSHIKRKEYKPSGYWTIEKCRVESLKYNSRLDFQKNNTAAYIAARKNRWLDDICSHMGKKKNSQIEHTFE